MGGPFTAFRVLAMTWEESAMLVVKRDRIAIVTTGKAWSESLCPGPCHCEEAPQGLTWQSGLP